MESAIRAAVGLIHFLTWLLWLGALAFAAYRTYQMNTLPVVEAEVLKSETESYTSTSYRENAAGWNEQTQTRMYVPTALVRYTFAGQEFTANAKHDVGFSWKWVQDRLTRNWKSGSRIRIYIDPTKPGEPLAGLGFNLNTYLPAAFLVAFGFFLMGCAWGLSRVAPAILRLVSMASPQK